MRCSWDLERRPEAKSSDKMFLGTGAETETNGAMLRASGATVGGASSSAAAAAETEEDPWANWRPGTYKDLFEIVMVERYEPPVFDLVAHATAKGWDPHELIFHLHEYGEDGLATCELYYMMLADKNKSEETASEVYYEGGVLAEVPCPSEPEPIKEVKLFMKGVAGLVVWKVGLGESLREWHERIGLNRGDSGQDGYYTTIGGKILDPDAPVGRLGLGEGTDVIYQKRLRGGGYGGGGKGGAGGNRPAVPGEWTCTTCWAPRCWPVKTTCYQCGTPRDRGAGRKEAGAGGLGAQAGAGTAMGGTRLVGPTGRNQVHVPGGDPTHWANQARNSGTGGGGRGVFAGGGGVRGNVTPGAGVGVGGGRVEATVGAPLPVGVVLMDRDKVLQAMDVIKGVLGEEVLAAVSNLVQGHLPPNPLAPTPPSPTEAERFEKLTELARRKEGLEKKVEAVKGRLDRAREKVVEEEGNLGKAEADLAEAVEAYRVLREEDERRERARREEAQRAREPRCMELDGSDGEEEVVEEEEEEEVTLEGGKKRKVLRKVRASRANAFSELDMVGLHDFLKGLSKENKQACMRCLYEDGGSVEFGGGLNSDAACQGSGIQEDPNLTPCG